MQIKSLERANVIKKKENVENCNILKKDNSGNLHNIEFNIIFQKLK